MNEQEQAIEKATNTLTNSGLENHAIVAFDEDDFAFRVMTQDDQEDWHLQHLVGLLNLTEHRITQHVRDGSSVEVKH